MNSWQVRNQTKVKLKLIKLASLAFKMFIHHNLENIVQLAESRPITAIPAENLIILE